MSRRAASKPSRATHKSGRASAQAVWLRRRRSSINEPIANPPSATTGMTKRALRIVPPHCRSDGKSTAAGNLNHLSRPDGSCLAGWRAARNSRWGEFIMTATPADRGGARRCVRARGGWGGQRGLAQVRGERHDDEDVNADDHERPPGRVRQPGEVDDRRYHRDDYAGHASPGLTSQQGDADCQQPQADQQVNPTPEREVKGIDVLREDHEVLVVHNGRESLYGLESPADDHEHAGEDGGAMSQGTDRLGVCHWCIASNSGWFASTTRSGC